MANVIYNSFKKDVVAGAINLASDSFKVMLVNSSYAPDIDADTKRSHVTNEVAGLGYVLGGTNLLNPVVNQDNVNDRAVFTADSVEWLLSSITARGAVVYQDTGSAATDRLVAYIDFSSDKVSLNGSFTITWNASGIMLIA